MRLVNSEFWSSDVLTGNQTIHRLALLLYQFWSSDVLTGNQTDVGCDLKALDLEFFDSALFRSMGDIGKCVEDMLLSLLAYVAQTERKKNRQRQAEGIAIAKSLGKYKGKPKTIFPAELIDAANKALREEGKSAAAKILNVSRITVYRMIEDGRLKSA